MSYIEYFLKFCWQVSWKFPQFAGYFEPFFEVTWRYPTLEMLRKPDDYYVTMLLMMVKLNHLKSHVWMVKSLPMFDGEIPIDWCLKPHLLMVMVQASPYIDG